MALALLKLIGLFTNLFFYQRWSATMVSPGANHLGYWEVLVPVAGALVIGLMARYGSERIRGHGIPEAIEAILINGNKGEPKVAILKPLSSAISIGSGGPFGAEGPIIITGGAFGSMIAQLFHLSSTERKTPFGGGRRRGNVGHLCGSRGIGASGRGTAPLRMEAAEPRPSGAGQCDGGRAAPLHSGCRPLFPTPAHPVFIGPQGLLACVIAGLLAAALSALLTLAVYGAEDAFHHLPIHWMWWPAPGGLAIGLGGIEALFRAGRGSGLLAAGEYGGDSRRHDAFAVHGCHLRPGIDPLLAVTMAHAFTVLTLRRSILTEKVSRRGLHLSREYAVDPLETLSVREVMRPGAELNAAGYDESVEAYPDEPLRVVVHRMADTGLSHFPVMERSGGTRLGMVSLEDLLLARTRSLDEDRLTKRTRVALLRTSSFVVQALLERPRRSDKLSPKIADF